MPDMPLWMDILYAIGVAELVFIWLACAAFLVLCRPRLPWKHGRAGAHLLVTSHTILGLVSLSLFNLIFNPSLAFLIVTQVVVLTALSYAMASRIGLYLAAIKRGKTYMPCEDEYEEYTQHHE